jgi:hypothetical protein
MEKKYNWGICKRCHSSFIPWKEKQKYCSFWCEMLDEKAGKRDVSTAGEGRTEEGQMPVVVLVWVVRKKTLDNRSPICYNGCVLSRRGTLCTQWRLSITPDG